MRLIRAATLDDSRAIGQVRLDSWRSAYAHLLPADRLARFSCAEREAGWRERLTETDDWVLPAAAADGRARATPNRLSRDAAREKDLRKP